MGNSILAVILGDALQQFLHRLVADEELLLVVCMNYSYLHCKYLLRWLIVNLLAINYKLLTINSFLTYTDIDRHIYG